jgi:hypothetical protein
MKTEWNPNDFQGRTEEQVRRNNKVFGISMIILIIGVTLVKLIF